MHDHKGKGRSLLTAALCAAVFVALAGAAPARAGTSGYPGPYWPYSPIGPFLGANESQTRNGWVHTHAVKMNHEVGLPQALDGRTPYWNTVIVANYGLQEFDIYYFHHQKRHLKAATRAANWLVGWQEAGGGWPYLISSTYPDGQEISPPWLACQAQGEAISLLVRMYALTGQPEYLHSAQLGMQALEHLTVNVDGHELLEGFPTAKPTATLEDLQLALLGLYSLSYFDRAAASAFAHYSAEFFADLSLWDGPNGPWYDLSYLNGTPPHYEAFAAVLNADLLGVLAEVTESPQAKTMAEKWLAERPSSARVRPPQATSLAQPLWPAGMTPGA